MSDTIENSIFETEYWTITLNASDQTYLGRSFIVLKRNCGDLAEVTDAELLDFKKIVGRFQDAARKAFNVTMFNWTCMMNSAYQNNPPDPWVHWHVRPRYDHEVEFAGMKFEDTEFGHHYLRKTNRSVDAEVSQKIVEAIQKNLL